MPEGPSILILKEQTQQFVGKAIVGAQGNSKIDKSRIVGKRIVAIRSFGKQLLIELADVTIRIHLLMFGSYRVNEQAEGKTPRLQLKFAKGQLNFYSCSVRYVEGDLAAQYDWRADVMSDLWDEKLASKKLLAMPKTLVCDALLDQDIFAGVGNIIKNEVLFRIRLHPLSLIDALSRRKLNELIREARNYSFEFLEWKKEFTLRKHWLAHNKGICPRDGAHFHREYLGIRNRRTFYCDRCQILYTRPREHLTRSKKIPHKRLSRK